MKKKVLFIAPYRQTDGWGEKARILAAMLYQLCDLTLRPIWFNGEVNSNLYLGDMEQLESKNEKEFDIVIQFGLPSYFTYDGRFKKNIAITSLGCTHKNIDISSVLNMFDKVAVFSELEAKHAFESGISKDKIVDLGCEPYVSPNISNATFDFGVKGLTFYTTASMAIDSGLRETLTAYLSLPQPIGQEVTLAVLTNNPEEVKNEVDRIQGILGMCHPTQYPKIAICNPTDAKDTTHYIQQAHYSFDVFVNVPYNPSVCKDTLTAFGAGSKVISSISSEHVSGEAYQVETVEDICLNPNRPLPYMFTGNTTWNIPVMKSIRHVMQKIIKKEPSGEPSNLLEVKEKYTNAFRQRLEELL